MNLTTKDKIIIKEKEEPPKPKEKDSYWTQMINGMVRPPRAMYRDTQLGKYSRNINSGTKTFTYKQIHYTRCEETVKFADKRISLTILQPENANSWIVVYCHGNSSSKLEAVSLLKYLPRGFSLGCFDFMGCGKNQQSDNITLGARQSEQVGSIVDFLEREKSLRVVLWGRSMGAASALKYGKAEVIIADSSFKCLKSLCKQVAKRHSPSFVPDCMVNCFFPCVFLKLKADVQRKAEYDVESVDIKQAVRNIDPHSMVIFMSGDKDTLIHHRNSEKLYKAFPGENKHLEIFEGTHNTKRPEEVMLKVMAMIEEYAKNNKQLKPRMPDTPKKMLREDESQIKKPERKSRRRSKNKSAE